MKVGSILCVLLWAICVTPSFAQISKEQVKERKLMKNSSRSELMQKATKVARKEAKKWVKRDG